MTGKSVQIRAKIHSAIISMVKHRISCLRIVLRAQCTVRIGFNDCPYLPISRCWQGGNCSTSWMNYATFGFDLDCYLCSSSLARRDSCTTYGWPLTLDALFLNRPCGCMKIQEKQTTWSIGSASWSCFYMLVAAPWKIHWLNIHYPIVRTSNVLGGYTFEEYICLYGASRNLSRFVCDKSIKYNARITLFLNEISKNLFLSFPDKYRLSSSMLFSGIKNIYTRFYRVYFHNVSINQLVKESRVNI